MTSASDSLVLLVSDDLLFPSRVREAIRNLPYRLQIAATAEAAKRAVSEAIEARINAAILVNLTARRYDPLALIRDLKADPETSHLPLLAFAGHVEREKHQAAREAGANLTAANSSVSLHLPALLSRMFAADSAHEDVVIDLADDEATSSVA